MIAARACAPVALAAAITAIVAWPAPAAPPTVARDEHDLVRIIDADYHVRPHDRLPHHVFDELLDD